MKKIYILTAGYGEGHNTAARNLHAALEHLSPGNVYVEVIDPIQSSYRFLDSVARKTYSLAIEKTPKLWHRFYQWIDQTSMGHHTKSLSRLRQNLEQLILSGEPDVIISTYPLYNYLIDEIFQNKRPRRFSQMTMITDSITVNSIWYRCSSDWFFVPNEASAEILRASGIPSSKVRTFGFPVHLDFSLKAIGNRLSDPSMLNPRILFLANAHRKKAPRILELLLEQDHWKITVCVGRNKDLEKELSDVARHHLDRVRILGWTDQMPYLMMTHHLLISKAGGATVQESIAACCPMIITKVVPGQEEGNYELLRRANAGMLAQKPKEIVECAIDLFKNDAALWKLWRQNLRTLSQPAAALDIGKFILREADQDASLEGKTIQISPRPPVSARQISPRTSIDFPAILPASKKLLLCDFHTHTTFSDGKLTLPELVDFYGTREFDCLCVTDHLCDPSRLIGKACQWSGLVLHPSQLANYFESIEREKKRAWDRYQMLLLTGIEFNKDGYTKKTSAHLLGIDLQEPIDPTLSIAETIEAIHQQNALAVASHPHEGRGTWGKDTLYFWENQEKYAPLLDAWEIANRDDLYNPVGLKRLAFIANSDFHKPKHIHSWKTLLHCEKDPEAIKACIRENRDIAITLYRDHRFGNLAQSLPEIENHLPINGKISALAH